MKFFSNIRKFVKNLKKKIKIWKVVDVDVDIVDVDSVNVDTVDIDTVNVISDESYLVAKVIKWWKSSCDGSLLVMKVKEVEIEKW